jgi:hypothetical protein
MPDLLFPSDYTRSSYTLEDLSDRVLGDLGLRNNNLIRAGTFAGGEWKLRRSSLVTLAPFIWWWCRGLRPGRRNTRSPLMLSGNYRDRASAARRDTAAVLRDEPADGGKLLLEDGSPRHATLLLPSGVLDGGALPGTGHDGHGRADAGW